MTQNGQQSEAFDTERLLSEWRWLCPESVVVIQTNAFGDLLLRDEVGRVHLLNVGSGEIRVIAQSVAEFNDRAPTPEMQEEWFAASAVRAAQLRGLVPGRGQCIGFKTPVVFAEAGGADSAYVADLYEYVSFLGDIHGQIASLPDGAKVRLVIQPKKDSP
jgi:hypothetical protein